MDLGAVAAERSRSGSPQPALAHPCIQASQSALTARKPQVASIQKSLAYISKGIGDHKKPSPACSSNNAAERTYGVELNFQQQFSFLPAPLDGFGFQGNVTWLGGQFDTQLIGGVQQKGVAFQGLSDKIANASLFYEKFGLSARASYQWRSDWLDTLGGFGSGEYRKAYGNLDVSVRYKVNDVITLFADAANLTDEKYIAYEGTYDKPTEVEQIGARYMFGVRFNF